MTTHEATRQSVAEAYARAVKTGGGCCGGDRAGSRTAALAGYEADALAGVPGDAVANAFGCGDPLAFADVEPGATVVDLGSGAGIDLILAAFAVGPAGRVIGVDMTEEMVDRARANASEAGLPQVEVRRGLIEALPVETATADWVISNCVINLSPEKDRVFAEIARVLKPGGRMLVSDMVVDDLPDALRRNEALYHGCIGGAIGEADYLEGLRRAGLADVEVRDRHVYDAGQLAYLLGEGLHGDDGGSCCGVGGDGATDAATVAAQLAGRVQSIKVSAQKPSQG